MKRNNNIIQYNFDWDITKAKLNIKKHNVSFERAITVFKDKNSITIYDKEHSKIEDRWISLGMDYMGILIVVIHTFKKINKNTCLIRIISVRKAAKNEMKNYFGG